MPIARADRGETLLDAMPRDAALTELHASLAPTRRSQPNAPSGVLRAPTNGRRGRRDLSKQERRVRLDRRDRRLSPGQPKLRQGRELHAFLLTPCTGTR